MTAPRAEVRGSFAPAGTGAIRVLRRLPLGRLVRAWRSSGSAIEAVLAAWSSVGPGRAALVDEAGELSYAGLTDEVRRLRSWLGTSPDVIVCSARPRRIAVAVLAGLAAGCRVTLVPARAGALALDAARGRLPDAPVLGDGAHPERGATPGYRRAGPPEDAGSRRAPRPERPGRRVPRLTVSTSGTTAPSQGVSVGGGLGLAVHQLGLLGMIHVPPRPVVGCLAPLDHGHGFGVLGLTLLLGGTLLAGRTATAAAGTLDLLTGVPVQLLDYPAAARQRVGLILSGSDRLSDADAAGLQDRLGGPVLNAYGATEVGTVCLADEAARALAPGTVGRPLPGVRIRVLDAHGVVLPRGEAGLLEIRSPPGAGAPSAAISAGSTCTASST